MARPRTTYVCGECGGEQSRWHGRCPDCGAFATLVEQAPASDDARSGARRRVPRPARSCRWRRSRRARPTRIGTGIAELDRVLGGGLVPGSLVLLGGEPGVGKSTPVLQRCSARIGAHARRCCYVAGEESPEQVRAARRAHRRDRRAWACCAETELETVLRHDRGERARGLVIDSIQTL